MTRHQYIKKAALHMYSHVLINLKHDQISKVKLFMANLRPSHDTGARGRYPAKIQDMTMF